MSRSWQELRKEAYQLSVSDRLLLVEAIVRSLSNELRPRPPVPKGTLTGLHGLLKTDEPPPTDEEIEAMLEERLKEKYL
jgi:hypothetical protein